MLDGVLLSELGADKMHTRAGQTVELVSSVIFTPGGAAVGDDHSEPAAGAGNACGVGPVAGGSAAGACDNGSGR